MQPRESRNDSSARSPFAGCAILIAALLVMVFLVVFSVFSLFRQFAEIAKFTGEKPATLEVSQLEDQEAALNDLAVRLESFRQQLTSDGEAALALTPDEVNLAVAAYEPFKDLRGTFRVISADEGKLRIAISFPLNGKPRLTREGENGWITSDPRFLNGTMVARPALLKRELVLKLDDLEVPGASVPREFIEQMSPYRITERYLMHPVLGPAMEQLTSVEVADGSLRLFRKPGETPADVISEEQVDSAGNRFFLILGAAASLFLVFAGTIIFIGLRGKRQDKR
jgi:hypothetical protein